MQIGISEEMASLRTLRVDTDGAQLEVRDRGEGEPVVFSHGSMPDECAAVVKEPNSPHSSAPAASPSTEPCCGSIRRVSTATLRGEHLASHLNPSRDRFTATVATCLEEWRRRPTLGRGAPQPVPPHHQGCGRSVTLDPGGLRLLAAGLSPHRHGPERPARGATDRG
jgi:hypothetical protein